MADKPKEKTRLFKTRRRKDGTEVVQPVGTSTTNAPTNSNPLPPPSPPPSLPEP